MVAAPLFSVENIASFLISLKEETTNARYLV